MATLGNQFNLSWSKTNFLGTFLTQLTNLTTWGVPVVKSYGAGTSERIYITIKHLFSNYEIAIAFGQSAVQFRDLFHRYAGDNLTDTIAYGVTSLFTTSTVMGFMFSRTGGLETAVDNFDPSTSTFFASLFGQGYCLPVVAPYWTNDGATHSHVFIEDSDVPMFCWYNAKTASFRIHNGIVFSSILHDRRLLKSPVWSGNNGPAVFVFMNSNTSTLGDNYDDGQRTAFAAVDDNNATRFCPALSTLLNNQYQNRTSVALITTNTTVQDLLSNGQSKMMNQKLPLKDVNGRFMGQLEGTQVLSSARADLDSKAFVTFGSVGAEKCFIGANLICPAYAGLTLATP